MSSPANPTASSSTTQPTVQQVHTEYIMVMDTILIITKVLTPADLVAVYEAALAEAKKRAASLGWVESVNPLTP